MSQCIMHMRHQSRFILRYMGKLRFTLTNVLFWIVLLLSCFLSENFAILNNNPFNGFQMDSAFILTVSTILLLVLYYFLEHKKNGLTFDKVLLPSLVIAGLLLIWNIFRQGERTFTSLDGNETLSFSFTMSDRFLAALQVFVWLAVVYALTFVYNRFRLNRESYRWVAKVYLMSLGIIVLADVILEWNSIMAILAGTYQGAGLEFAMGNANVWSLLIFAGILTTVILSFKGFRLYYYIPMMFLYTFNLLTTCATTIYISTFLITFYTLYEILSRFKQNKKQSLINLLVYVGSISVTILFFAIMVLSKVSIFANFWSFMDTSIFHKDFLTATGRTAIWKNIWHLLSGNPLDLIFGLGHKTANKIFLEYMSGYKSAHNAFLEMFLRYGIIGFAVYVGIVGLAFYCLIRHLLRKNYRFVFFYGICFLAILAHSVTESTTLFTPNVGGLYFSFVFVLPIINLMQEKRFNKLKQDLVNANVPKGKIKECTYFGLILYFAICAIITKIISLVLPIDLFSAILVILVIFLVGVIIISFARKNKDYNPLAIMANNALVYYQNLVRKDNDDEK